jgi:hypothetical protein
MDKRRLLLVQMAAIGLVLLLALDLFLGMTTLAALNQLVLKLYQEGVY